MANTPPKGYTKIPVEVVTNYIKKNQVDLKSIYILIVLLIIFLIFYKLYSNYSNRNKNNIKII